MRRGSLKGAWWLAGTFFLLQLRCDAEAPPADPLSVSLGIQSKCSDLLSKVTLHDRAGGEARLLVEKTIASRSELPFSQVISLDAGTLDHTLQATFSLATEPPTDATQSLRLPYGSSGRITMSLPCVCIGVACPEGENCVEGEPGSGQVFCAPVPTLGDGRCSEGEASLGSPDCAGSPEELAGHGGSSGQSGAGGAGAGGAGAGGEAGAAGQGAGGAGAGGAAGTGGAAGAGQGGAGMSGASGQAGSSGSAGAGGGLSGASGQGGAGGESGQAGAAGGGAAGAAICGDGAKAVDEECDLGPLNGADSFCDAGCKQVCPKQVDGRCMVVSPDYQTRAEAKIQCQLRGGQLATLCDQAQLTKAIEGLQVGEGLGLWIGLHDPTPDLVEEWVWDKGSCPGPLPWRPGEPNDYSPTPDVEDGAEECVMIAVNADGVGFNDENCAGPLRYLCER